MLAASFLLLHTYIELVFSNGALRYADEEEQHEHTETTIEQVEGRRYPFLFLELSV